uniref:Immunoglobulin domain-containing protein n=1 Tax=Mola mola TaxID=94237 RepID=A0A3Q3X9M9_MOLML
MNRCYKLKKIHIFNHITFLHCLFGETSVLLRPLLPDSFSPSPSTRYVTFKVGNKAVLPCGWKPRLGEVTPPICHIQWKTPAKTVFELRGGRKWQAQELEGQANVPAETLESGDCSLIISDVQISDAGRYESFMVVDAAGRKSRVFIQSVQLSVFDHKSLQSHALGDDLVLDLYTPRAFMAIFQGRNSSDWSVLWTQGDNDSRRVQKDGLREQLTVKKLKPEDEGTYRVMDEHGLAISTVLLSVEGETAELMSANHTAGKTTLVTRRLNKMLILFVLSSVVESCQ